MRKYFLLISTTLMMVNSAHAMTAEQQLGMMKDIYIKEFIKMDTDKNGVVSKSEYLRFQFENFRTNIIEAESFDSIKTISAPVETEKKKENSLNTDMDKALSAIEEMAKYELDAEDDGISDNVEVTEEKPQKLTKEDVMPEEEIDFSSLANENLEEILEGNSKASAEDKGAEPSKEELLASLMETIKETLPKPIDDVTTWTDILYKDNMIHYIYQADIELDKMTGEEIAVLKDNIKNETCKNAYKDMCPKVKPMFIDRGINMRIVYFDKNQQELSSCEFNEKTCE